jgi:hypothetical protein
VTSPGPALLQGFLSDYFIPLLRGKAGLTWQDQVLPTPRREPALTEFMCHVPKKFGYLNLAPALSELALPFDATAQDLVTLDLTDLEFCDPSAAVVLAAFGAHLRETCDGAYGWTRRPGLCLPKADDR